MNDLKYKIKYITLSKFWKKTQAYKVYSIVLDYHSSLVII